MFGHRLRELRKKRGMTQEDLEAASGVAQEYISGLERGVRSNPSREVIKSLALALEVAPEELAGAMWEDETSANGSDVSLLDLAQAVGSSDKELAEVQALWP